MSQRDSPVQPSLSPLQGTSEVRAETQPSRQCFQEPGMGVSLSVRLHQSDPFSSLSCSQGGQVPSYPVVVVICQVMFKRLYAT